LATALTSGRAAGFPLLDGELKPDQIQIVGVFLEMLENQIEFRLGLMCFSFGSVEAIAATSLLCTWSAASLLERWLSFFSFGVFGV
jgi:hypothetical protein